MTDTIFAAEMAALAADRRAREKGRVGDGMAAGQTDPERPDWHAGWMDFTGPRVPVPKTNEPSAPAQSLHSIAHRHTGQSECLETVAGGIRLTPRRDDPEVPEPGWVKCSHNGVRYHLHGERLMAHFSGDRRACPEGVVE